MLRPGLRRQREIDQRLADQAYDWLCHNIYIKTGALEEEIASLNRKSTSLDRELFLAERAVQAGERWVAQAEELIPEGEEAVLQKHKELDETTRLLEQVTEETEELEREVEAAVEQGQLPPAVLEQLRWIRGNPEDAELMGATALTASALRGAVGHAEAWPQVSGEQGMCAGAEQVEEEEVSRGQVVEEQRAIVEEEKVSGEQGLCAAAEPVEEEVSGEPGLCAGDSEQVEKEVRRSREQVAEKQRAAAEEEVMAQTRADQDQKKMEEGAPQDHQPATRQDAEEDEDEKQTCGCFRALWNWIRRR